MKRCYSMRGTLALLDFEDPSIQGVQALMVRGAMLPAFLRCADGRKFIAHLFTLHVTSLHPARNLLHLACDLPSFCMSSPFTLHVIALLAGSS